MWGLFSNKKSDIPRRRLDSTSVDNNLSNMFVRNRTMNNLSLAADMVNLEAESKSSRSHIHHLTGHRRKVLYVQAVVLLVSLLIWLLLTNFTATPVIRISAFGVSKSIDFKRYEAAINEYLDINPASRLSFVMNSESLNSFMLNKLPEVSMITQQDSSGFGKTNFSVTLRTPVAGWKSDNKQYYVDSNGVSFQVNYYNAPLVQIIDNSGASVSNNNAVISNRFLSFVGKVVSAAKNSGYTVTQATLPIDTTRELDILTKDSDIVVKLSIDRPAGEQIEDMVNAFSYFNNRGQVPGYIDVRVSGKAFYK